MDGHVTHGDLTQSKDESAQRLNAIGNAILQYTQDYDDKLPILDGYGRFKNELAPYLWFAGIGDEVFIDPATGRGYHLNKSISGLSLGDITDPANIPVVYSKTIDSDGQLFTGYLDGHVDSQNYYAYNIITTGTDGRPALVANKYDEATRITDIADDGRPVRTLSYGINSSSVINQTVKLEATHLGDGRILFYGSHIQTTNQSGAVEGQINFGPFDGWKSLALAVGPDNEPRLLLGRYDGEIALLHLNHNGEYLSDTRYHVSLKDTVKGLFVGNDGNIRIVIEKHWGGVRIWTLGGDGFFAYKYLYDNKDYPQFISSAIGTDNRVRLLWFNKQSGVINVQKTGDNGDVSETDTYQLPLGETPTQLAIDNNHDYLVLSKSEHEPSILRKFAPLGALVYKRVYPATQ